MKWKHLGATCILLVIAIITLAVTQCDNGNTETSSEDIHEKLDIATILTCAKLSQAAYDKPGKTGHEARRQQLVQTGYDVVIFESLPITFSFSIGGGIPLSTNKGLLLVRGETPDGRKQQFISIEGTNGINEWAADVDYPEKVLHDELEISIHRQFAAFADRVYDRIKDQLHPDYETYVTGHSLGGAIAAVVGMLIQHNSDSTVNLKKVYTFGQPKLTNSLKNNLDDSGVWIMREFPLLRVVNSGDPVPTLPPYSFEKRWVFGTGYYAHFGDALIFDENDIKFQAFLNNDGDIHEDAIERSSASGITLTFTQAIAEILDKVKNDTTQHGMELYIKNLESLQN